MAGGGVHDDSRVVVIVHKFLVGRGELRDKVVHLIGFCWCLNPVGMARDVPTIKSGYHRTFCRFENRIPARLVETKTAAGKFSRRRVRS